MENSSDNMTPYSSLFLLFLNTLFEMNVCYTSNNKRYWRVLEDPKSTSNRAFNFPKETQNHSCYPSKTKGVLYNT
jgi:hypothetical protein